MLDHKLFSFIDSNNPGKFLKKSINEQIIKNKKISTINTLLNSNLETELNNNNNINNNIKDSKNEQIDLNQHLGNYLEKIGGINTWQKRWFDFFPFSGCLVWRSKPIEPKIKGILFIDNNCKVLKFKNEKGRNFVIEITPYEGKHYHLSFENENLYNLWFNSLQNKIKPKN